MTVGLQRRTHACVALLLCMTVGLQRRTHACIAERPRAMSKSQGKVAPQQRPSKEPTLSSIVEEFIKEYEKTPLKLKVLDCFAACALLTALVQFVYAMLVGTFPFNAFLAGFFCCIGSFVLTVSLRMQVSEDGSSAKSPQRALVDYVLAMTVLFLAVWNYIG